MTFSGALTLTDLNDYITPSQACIKPVEHTNAPKVRTPGDAATEIQIDASGAYYEVGQGAGPSGSSSNSTQKLQTAEITLNDCLACSGCITSAESVLITLQSHTEVRTVLEENPSPGSPGYRVPVLSIAPQSLASLAAALCPASPSGTTPVPLARMLSRVRAFATHTLGFAHVFDTTFAREVALREHAREFFERKERAVVGGGSDCDGALPMLSSACPGWVCYAEKTHGEMLPFIASTKSPQQVMGTLVKEWLGPHYWDKHPDEVYHVTVMPCYDKKLEASRSDFYNEQYATRDVDCVLTTGELLLLAQEHGVDLSLPIPEEDVSPSPSSTSATPVLPDLLNPAGSSSGSYLYSLMLAVARTHPRPLTLESKTVRSADYVEYTLRDTTSGGPPVFRGATCYGFRNLQNVVRRVGRAAGVQVGRGAAGRLAGGLRGGTVNRTANGAGAAYDYVEVMACPGGCVGGGGQLRPPERKTASDTGANDAEGFARDWAADGVVVGGTGQEGNSKTETTRTKASAADREAPWSSRAWTREVERAYWGGGPAPALELGLGLGHASLPTPPASPKIRSGLSEGIMGGTSAAESCGTSHGAEEEGVASPSPTLPRSHSGRRQEEGLAADRSAERNDDDDVDDVEALVERALRELCAPVALELELGKAGGSADGTRRPGPGRRNFWMARMDEATEARRRAYFRTQYRAVESEVVGLGVKW